MASGLSHRINEYMVYLPTFTCIYHGNQPHVRKYTMDVARSGCQLVTTRILKHFWARKLRPKPSFATIESWEAATPNIYIYNYNICIYIYTWNLFVLYFWASTLQNKALSNKNNGHLGSRYIVLKLAKF